MRRVVCSARARARAPASGWPSRRSADEVCAATLGGPSSSSSSWFRSFSCATRTRARRDLLVVYTGKGTRGSGQNRHEGTSTTAVWRAGLQTGGGGGGWVRGYASVLGERRKELEELAALFAEARDEIESARESAGTTYFNDDFDEAKKCTVKALEYYNKLLSEFSREESLKLKEEQNPKMEQLKMELSMLEDLAAD